MEKNKYKVGIITLSDKGSAGQREDLSGPSIQKMLEPEGIYEISETIIIPDERELIEEKLIEFSDEKKYDLILTTGGTGLSPRDVTPEATLAVATKNVPGIAEYMRAESFKITNRAMLSRAVSVIRNDTLIINLPGSPHAVKENLSFILPGLKHGMEIMTGRTHECARK